MGNQSSELPDRRRLQDLAIIGGVALSLLALVSLFSWFWQEPPLPGGAALARFVPLPTGESRLRVQRGVDGSVTRWMSENVRIIPWIRLFNELNFGISSGISKTYLNPDAQNALTYEKALSGALLIAVNRQEVSASGAESANTSYFLRDPRGLLLVGTVQADEKSPRFFDPPIVSLPNDLAEGQPWSGSGVLGFTPYRWSAELESRGPFTGGSNSFPDCLQIRSVFELGRIEATSTQTVARSWYCDSFGLVTSESVSDGGAPVRIELAAITDRLPNPPYESPGAIVDTDLNSPSNDWGVQRFAETNRMGQTSAATFAPVWMPGDPPLLLAAEQNGPLVAFSLESGLSAVRWQFYPGGSIYGAPAVHPTSGHIYFGASDKRVYALDRRGLFLWAFSTRDNIAAQPALFEDLVIFAGEDHTVYALDAELGTLRWSMNESGPIASSPAVIGDTVVFASDDQGVYGLDARTGAARWSYSAPSPVEAPVVRIGGTRALIASRDGTLTLLDVNECRTSCQALWTVNVGATVRRAPVLLGDTVYAVDEAGTLTGVDVALGKQRWTKELNGYIGPALALDDSLIVARRNGLVEALNEDGATLSIWDINTARSPLDAARQLAQGPSAGGGSLWLADRASLIWRIGPEIESPVSLLRADWILARSNLRGERERFNSTPLVWRENVIVLDSALQVSVLDVERGTLTKLGSLPGDEPADYQDPVLAGDHLVALRASSIVSMRLPDGDEAWRSQAPGKSLRPPATTDNSVIWLTGNDPSTTAQLKALDATNGNELWSVPLDGFFLPGGAVISGRRVVISSPPSAFDLDSGQQLWRADIPGLGLGGPGLDEHGQTTYVGYADTQSGLNGLAALDVASGQVLWTTDLGPNLLAPGESPILSDQTLIVPISTGDLLGLDPKDGSLRWEYSPPGPRMGNVTVSGGTAWLMTESARVIVVDVQSGRLIGQYASINQNVGSPSLLQRPLESSGHVIIPLGPYLLGLESMTR